MGMPLHRYSDKRKTGGGSEQDKDSCIFPVAFPPAAVLFDWDHTLVDSWKTILYAINNTLITFGLEPWTEHFAAANIQRSGRDSFPQWFGNRAQEAQDLFYKIMAEEHLQGLNPMPDSQGLLDILHQKGIPIGVVSNKSSAFLRKEVAYLKWEHYFQVVVGAGDSIRDKPAADPLLLALKKLDVPASRKVWMIGDAPVDWDCAIAAGCQPVAIFDRFEHHSPLIVSIENCGDLKKIFSKM